MATNDLMTELQKDSIKLDDDSERKVCLYCFTVRPVKVFELCIDPLITYRLTGREDDSQAPGRQKRRGSEPGCQMVKTLPFFLRLLPVAARLVTSGAFVFRQPGAPGQQGEGVSGGDYRGHSVHQHVVGQRTAERHFLHRSQNCDWRVTARLQW